MPAKAELPLPRFEAGEGGRRSGSGGGRVRVGQVRCLSYPHPPSLRDGSPSPAPKRGRGKRNGMTRWPSSQHRGLDDVDAALAIDQVAEPALVDGDVVGGGELEALRGIRLVEGDFARLEGIGDVEDAQALREPGEGNDAAFEALGWLVTAH